MPLRNPDFAPFLQKVRDAKPDALFVFVPSGQGAAFMKQFVERGLDKSGIKLIATGDVTDDDQLNDMGDVALGVVNSHHYSAAHPSAMNKKFVEAFEKANKMRPNFMAVGGYDGMRVIYKALKATKGAGRRRRAAGGDEGPGLREPARPGADRRADARHRAGRLHPQGRAVQDGQQLYNVEFDVIKAVKDPGKAQVGVRAERGRASGTPC